ncbi:MAG TPA: hypothetical protein PLL76_17715 [Thermoanaerobaculia bacterium]|jgi:hypothetical protein|nr:hypothetical protein [Thermoanaerobaculia bacterium]HQP88090.1 hypothetical protein [Thermoanaerobaculia bacterium]
MRRTATIAAIAFLACSLSGAAVAQMMGGGMGSGGHGNGHGGSSTGPRGTGGMGSGSGMGWGMGDDMGGMGRVLVSPAGTAFLVSRELAGTGTSAVADEILAISPNGTNAWSWRSTDAIRDLTLATDLLVVSTGEPHGYGTTGTAPRTGALVALRSTTGAEAWRLAIDGVAMRVEAASDRLVILVGTPTSTTTGGTTTGHMGPGEAGFQGMRRSLVAVDLTGRLLWTVALDQ